MRLIDADKIIFREIDEIGGEYEPYLGCSKSQIDSLPSVTPQGPRKGHWIGSRRVGCGFGECKEYIVPIKDGIVTNSCHCSECGEWLTGSDEYECYGNYCPNCGAKMVEPQESEDT